MTRTLAVSVFGPALALVLLAGCGSAEQGSRDAADKEQTSSPRSSPSGSPSASPSSCTQTVKTVAQADLDGDGTREQVQVGTGGGGTCPDNLSVAGKVGDPYVGVDLPTDEPPVRSGFGVAVPGRKGELVVTRQDHPRGGFQLRVYAAGDGKLVELEVDGHSLVPFAALDVQEHPLSIDCTNGGVVITEAVAHEPPGVMFAWDIRRTPYVVDGTTVTAGTAKEIADNVLPGQLGAKYPDLVKYTAFKSCRSGG